MIDYSKIEAGCLLVGDYVDEGELPVGAAFSVGEVVRPLLLASYYEEGSKPNDIAAVPMHTFTVILSGIPELTPAIANSLYRTASGTYELSVRNGVVFMRVVRSAATLQEAMTTVILEIEQANIGASVIPVE